MTGYRISEVAQRSGFSPATLRYYEAVGVVPPPERSEAGYRVYDDRALARLTFVRRAKQLGLSLEAAADLTELWDGDECGAVQRRLAACVAEKLADTRSRVAELQALADHLQAEVAGLADVPNDGPCDENCACNTSMPAPPIACTLDSDLVSGRIADWVAVANRAVRRERSDGGVRLGFAPQEGLAADLAALAEAEQACCAFFDFTINIHADEVTLDVRAPAEAGPLLDQLFPMAP